MSIQSHQSKIVTPVLTGVSGSGKNYAKFDIEKGRTLIPCVAWEHVVEGCDFKALSAAELETPITLRGFEGDSGELVIKWFKLSLPQSESEALTEQERIWGYYGGRHRAEELAAEHRGEMLAKGFVWVGEGYEKRSRSVFDSESKRWHRKIDFCMDVLGTQRVKEELKKLFPSGLSVSEMFKGGFPWDEYDKLMEGLVRESRSVRDLQVQSRSA